ncbi:MAG: hypothetical protein WC871_02170 [Bacteroidales bacterium]
MKALLCFVYANGKMGRMANSVEGDQVYLTGEGVTGPFDSEKSGDTPVVKLVKRQIGGREYTHAEPVAQPPAGYTGWMSGGTFIYTSDSRFPSDYPIPLHDRTETWETYERMSQ